MENQSLKREYFRTLREEIKETKARIFYIIMLAILGFCTFCYFADSANYYVVAVVPFAILVLMVLYLTEQNELMRAGRYILENVESGDDEWEHWVAAHHLRGPESWFFAFFVIVFLVFYAAALSLAIQKIIQGTPDGSIYEHLYWTYAAPIAYGVGTLWALVALARFWRSSTSTS